MKHKKIIVVSVIVLAISFILIALFNSTYAMFSSDDYAKGPENYSTGLLQIEAVSKTENISLTNALPMIDDAGILSEPFVFTIKNVGNLNYKFDIKLLTVGSDVESFSSQYIKVQVDNGDVLTLKDLSNGVIKKDVILNVGESVDISIRLWLSIDTPNTELGKVFNSKIVTDGQAIYTESNYDVTTFAEYINNLYINDTKKEVVNNNISYNYGTSTNLMNDKLGGTLESDSGNVRYYGATPNNYVYFNCNDYNNQSSSTCEKWRIIGVFDGKVKIVREEKLGTYAFDYTSAYKYDNNWHDATINTLFNDGYYNNLDNVTTYHYSEKKKTTNFATSGIGIKNDETRNMISESIWYLGDGGVGADTYVDAIYQGERGDDIGSNTEKTWKGKIALMYPSDYGYATNLELCKSTLKNYSDSNCLSNNWLYNLESDDYEWLLTPAAATSGNHKKNSIWRLNGSGGVSDGIVPRAARNVRPTLYLDANVVKVSGIGTSSNPYQIASYNSFYNAVDYITGLYLNNKNKIVKNGAEGSEIEYQYAESVNLMNDRLGGTTSDYDAGNIRYYGANPNNYVDIGDRDSSGNIIPYRIIGVFKDMELSDGTKRDLIKVIRNDSIGNFAWDNKTDGIGSSTSPYRSNDWSDARLMMMLNPGYDIYSETSPLLDSRGNILYGYQGSLWWNSRNGTCYVGTANATAICDFTSTGLSKNVQNKIESVVWNLGGWRSVDIYPNTAYEWDKGTDVYEGRPTEWTGKIALCSGSDYDYAVDFSSCNNTVGNYETSCYEVNWMYIDINQWTLSPSPLKSYMIVTVDVVEDIMTASRAVRPSFYLDSELSIVSGEGTKDRPYVLG